MLFHEIRWKRKNSIHKLIYICLLSILIISLFMFIILFYSDLSTSSTKNENSQEARLYLYSQSHGHKMSVNKSIIEVEFDIENIEWRLENTLIDKAIINSVDLNLKISNPNDKSVRLNITLLDEYNEKLTALAGKEFDIKSLESLDFFIMEFKEGDNYTFEKGSRIILNITTNNSIDLEYNNASINFGWIPDYGLNLACDIPNKSLDISEANAYQSYDINIKNLGEKMDTYYLETIVPKNKKWFSEIYPKEIMLQPGTSKNFTLFIYSINLTEKEFANISVKATSKYSPFPIFNQINTTTTTIKTYGFIMVATTNANTLNWGEDTNYNIIITNNKTINMTIDFGISKPPKGWKANISKNNILLDELGKSSYVILTVTAPLNFSEKLPKKAEIKIIATIRNSTYKSEILTISIIKENPLIKINEIIFSNEKPKTGQKIKISSNISNIGRENAKVIVIFYDGNKNESSTIGIFYMELGENESNIAFIFWNSTHGKHVIFVVVKTLDFSFSLDISSKKIIVTENEKLDNKIIIASGGVFGFALILAFFTETGRYSILKFLAIPLYTRIKKDKVLDHNIRLKVYSHIQSNPGAHFRSIMKSLSLKNGALAYHLSTLERAEYIKSQRDGIYRKFYLKPGRLDEPSKILKSPDEIKKLILEKIRMEPGISQSRIAKSINESRQLVNNYIKILKDEGKIYLKKNGRESKCFIEET